MALLRCLECLERLNLEGERFQKVRIIRQALEEPARQIALNAGAEGSVVVEQIKKEGGDFGFNAAENCFADMMEAGIMDPVKVVRSALQNAAGVASLLLTTEAVITDRK